MVKPPRLTKLNPEIQRRGLLGAQKKKETKGNSTIVPTVNTKSEMPQRKRKAGGAKEGQESDSADPHPPPTPQKKKPRKAFLQNSEKLAINNPEAIADLHRMYNAGELKPRFLPAPANPPQTTYSEYRPYIVTSAWDTNNNPTAVNRPPSPLRLEDLTDSTGSPPPEKLAKAAEVKAAKSSTAAPAKAAKAAATLSPTRTAATSSPTKAQSTPIGKTAGKTKTTETQASPKPEVPSQNRKAEEVTKPPPGITFTPINAPSKATSPAQSTPVGKTAGNPKATKTKTPPKEKTQALSKSTSPPQSESAEKQSEQTDSEKKTLEAQNELLQQQIKALQQQLSQPVSRKATTTEAKTTKAQSPTAEATPTTPQPSRIVPTGDKKSTITPTIQPDPPPPKTATEALARSGTKSQGTAIPGNNKAKTTLPRITATTLEESIKGAVENKNDTEEEFGFKKRVLPDEFKFYEMTNKFDFISLATSPPHNPFPHPEDLLKPKGKQPAGAISVSSRRSSNESPQPPLTGAPGELTQSTQPVYNHQQPPKQGSPQTTTPPHLAQRPTNPFPGWVNEQIKPTPLPRSRLSGATASSSKDHAFTSPVNGRAIIDEVLNRYNQPPRIQSPIPSSTSTKPIKAEPKPTPAIQHHYHTGEATPEKDKMELEGSYRSGGMSADGTVPLITPSWKDPTRPLHRTIFHTTDGEAVYFHFHHKELPQETEDTRWTEWLSEEEISLERNLRDIRDTVFNSQFSQEELDSLNLKAAGTLLPRLVNKEGTLRERAEKNLKLGRTIAERIKKKRDY